jgi:cbb3-type cytochrome oxidase subunit 1
MSAAVRNFLKSSLAWLALGVTLGVAMAAHPAWTLYRLAHVHIMLLGFVAMMIFGVAYHVIPHFVGFRLHRPALAGAHWWIANAGLVLMASGFVARVMAPTTGTLILVAGGTLSALGAYLFVYVIWRTIDGPSQLRAASERAARAVERSSTRGSRTLTVVAMQSGARHG